MPQKGHLQPAVWVRMCMLRAAGLLYSLLHTEQFWAALSGVISRATGSDFTRAAMDRSSGSLCSAARAGDQMLRLGKIVLLYRK